MCIRDRASAGSPPAAFSPAEFETGTIPGARNLPWSDGIAETIAARVPRSTPVVFVCAWGFFVWWQLIRNPAVPAVEGPAEPGPSEPPKKRGPKKPKKEKKKKEPSVKVKGPRMSVPKGRVRPGR